MPATHTSLRDALEAAGIAVDASDAEESGDRLPPLNYDDCLEGPDGCTGDIEYREALSITSKRFPRCDKHWHERLQLEDAGWPR